MPEVGERHLEEIRRARDFMNLRASGRREEGPGGEPRLRDYLDAGYHGLLVPKKHGGRGLDYFSAGLVYEELSYGAIGDMPSLLTVAHCAELLKIAADGKGENRWLDLLGAGKRVFGFCLTEEDAGSDITGISTTAARQDGGRVLNGEKTVVINCGIADYYIVIATAGPGKGRAALEAFVVDGSLRGVACEPRREALCFRNSPIGAVRFDNVVVPPEGAVGGEGSGYLLVMETLDKGRPLVGACCVGAARRVFDMILAHAKSRKQFGKTLYSFQGISFKMADFSVRIRAATLLYRECLSRIDRGEGFTMEASMAKLYASETLRDIASFGLELMGQRGYREENALHEIFHASQLLISIDGSSNVQRMVIASQL